MPQTFLLSQNYPNPFNPRTEIRYQIPSSGHVSLRVYNILGQEVRTLVDRIVDEGHHVVTWDASDMASGVYFYRLTAGEFTDTKRMVLMK